MYNEDTKLEGSELAAAETKAQTRDKGMSQEDIFQLCHAVAMNSRPDKLFKMPAINLLAITLVGQNARTKQAFAERRHKEAETKAAALQKKLEAIRAAATGEAPNCVNLAAIDRILAQP